MTEQNNNIATNQSKGPKRDRVKSPMYPYITFTDALSKAKVLYKYERRNLTTPAILYQHLGYSKKTGSSVRVASALKQYGLIEEAKGHYKISDVAHRLFNLPEGDPEIKQIEVSLAMRPRIFKEILANYQDGLPSDASLKSYLILDKAFSENGTEIFIRVLKAALKLANESGVDYNKGDADEGEEELPAGETPDMQPQQNSPPLYAGQSKPVIKNPPPANEGESQFSISLTPGGEMKVLFSGEVTQDAFTVLQGILEMQKARPQPNQEPTKDTPAEPSRTYPCEAMWRNKDHDQPVTVTGELGEKDGKKFYSISESSTGISEDELDFEITESN